MKQAQLNKIKIISKKLDEACIIEFGTRVVQKKDGGAIYPVYGGGGATFKMDTYNRDNCLVVSRFAMSKQCTRFVEGKFYLNDSGLTIKPKNKEELAQEYLDYLLLSLNDRIYSLSRGTAQRNLNVTKFRTLEIKYPESIELQLHIANILSKAENLISQRKESIRLLDEFLKSTFLEMFGDPGINRKGWPIKPLGELLEYIGDIGSNGSNAMVAKNLEMLDEEDYAIMVRTTNFTKNDFTNNVKYVSQKTYDFFKKSKIYGGEIIMNKIGSAGDFWLMPKLNKPVSLGLNQLVLRPKNIPTLYLFHFLSTDYGRVIVKAQAKGATTKSITKTAVKALPIMFPHVELQNQFVALVEKTEALKTQYQQSLQELKNLYGSLSQKAFRGELGLKDEELLSSSEPARSMATEHGRSMAAERSRSMAAEPEVNYTKK